MMKQTLGVAIIALLAGVLIFNFMERNNDETSAENDDNVINVTGDSDVKGAAIVPPGTSGIEPGEMAPDFDLETMSGKKVSLSDFRGKKIFLNFWASWCSPCRLEMPEMQKFYEEYKDEVVILAVNTEIDKEKAMKYVKESGYTYPILFDKNAKVADAFEVYALPTTYFIGSDGKVQQAHKIGPMTYDYMVDMMNSME